METTDYRFHKGARTALTIAGVLCLLLIVAAPIGIWILMRVRSAKVSISPSEIRASALVTTVINLHDIQRIGVCMIPVPAAGIGGIIARMKVGGSHAANICVMTQAGKTKKFIASQYENWEQMRDQIAGLAGKPMETIPMGLMGIKWPKEPTGA
jgi:hypothetical protein